MQMAYRGDRWRRLAVPLASLLMGGVVWAAQAWGGDFRGGLISCGIMAAYATLLLTFGRRSDVVGVLSGAPRDERYRALDLRATAATGIVLILFVIGGFLWEVAHRRSGMPFTLMGAVAGLSYLGALVYWRFRG